MSPGVRPARAKAVSIAATAISAGRNHNCAIVTGGDLYCWGRNGFGEVGSGQRL